MRATEIITDDEFKPLYKDCDEIKAMLISSIKTAKANTKVVSKK